MASECPHPRRSDLSTGRVPRIGQSGVASDPPTRPEDTAIEDHEGVHRHHRRIPANGELSGGRPALRDHRQDGQARRPTAAGRRTVGSGTAADLEKHRRGHVHHLGTRARDRWSNLGQAIAASRLVRSRSTMAFNAATPCDAISCSPGRLNSNGGCRPSCDFPDRVQPVTTSYLRDAGSSFPNARRIARAPADER